MTHSLPAYPRSLLVTGAPYRSVAKRFELSESAVYRHKTEHLPVHLLKARDVQEVAQADDLLDQVRNLQAHALDILERAENAGDMRTALAAISQARGNLELLGKLAGELDELYFAIRPMLAVSGGTLMMLSTPHGKRGVFYEEWTGGRSWERFEVPAEECPRISPEFLGEKREALPSWVYRQEYECSFEKTEDQVFTTEMVERAVTPEVTPLFGGA